MVPFSSTHSQTEDFRSYRTESVLYPKAYDTLMTPSFYSDSGGCRWDSGEAHLFPARAETYYEPSAAQYTSYFAGAAALSPSAHAFAPVREEFGAPNGRAQQAYNGGMPQETRCEHFRVPNYGFEYGTGCPISSTTQNMVDLDLPTEPPRRTASPNSTVSGSEVGSVSFATDEQLCSLSVVEPDNTSPEIVAPHPAILLNHNVSEINERDSKIGKSNQKKILTATEKDLERRRKNNEASRKSRAQRKDRFLMDVREVEFLKIENQRLKDFLTELELVIKEANDTLIAKFKYQLPTAFLGLLRTTHALQTILSSLLHLVEQLIPQLDNIFLFQPIFNFLHLREFETAHTEHICLLSDQSMAVESIHAVREAREGHPSGQQTGSSTMGGSGGGEWDDSLWSLSCTESENQSSETNPPASGFTRSFTVHTAHSAPEQKVAIRRQPGLTRRHLQRAKTLGCYLPLTIPCSPSTSPNPPKPFTASRIPAAIGLDCFELRRRSRNAEVAKRLSHIARAVTNTTAPVAVDEAVGERSRRERYGVRRIQSLNRYTTAVSNGREPCQLSWESLSTKPPRPPTVHSSTAASPSRLQTLDSEMNAGRVAEMVKVEALQSHQQQQIKCGKIQGSRSFDQTVMTNPQNIDVVTTEGIKCKSSPSHTKQSSEAASPPCSTRQQQAFLPSPYGNREAPLLIRPSFMRTPISLQGGNIQKSENASCFEQLSADCRKISSTAETPNLQVPVVPVAMAPLASPLPHEIGDEVTIGCLHQQQQLATPARLSPSTTITLYELIQFCHLSSTHVPPQASNNPLRRNSWEAGELIPGLGIRVSVVSVKFPPHIRPQRVWCENTRPRPLHPTPRSAFTPLAGPERCALPSPLVVVIDEVSISGSMFFQPGQIILEVNGVNLFSVPTTSKQSLLTRLIQVIFAAYNSGDGGLYFTLATPYPWLVKRVSHEAIETRLHEQH
ncbi:hypothetical protein ECG_04092 [Echinococcus granulosus]|nr:hypothetical protein ECG_04092 [Echinococcus granulosus]